MANPISPDTVSPVLLFDAAIDCRFQVRQIHPDAAGMELERIQFDDNYRAVAEKKYHHLIIKAQALSAPGANVLKQTCLSLGTDAGVHHGAINCTIDREAVLITGTLSQLERLVRKLKPQPFGLKPLSESISRMLQRQKRLQQAPVEIMAILNVTPDSFSDGGTLSDEKAVLDAAKNAIDNGATILDIGGESTRPGAKEVSVEIEMARVVPVIETLKKHFPDVLISIDTRKSEVARAAVQAGAGMINDVSGLQFDEQMAKVAAETGVKLVIMHSQGTPETMQLHSHYEDVVAEVAEFFYRQVALATDAGVALSQIILDPGFGFGKTREHNLTLLARMSELVSIGFPVLIGPSRKSFLTLGQDIELTDRESLTAAAITLGISAGAQMVRLHDIQTLGPVVKLLTALKETD